MSSVEPGTDRLLVAELVGLLNDAEHYNGPGSTPDSRLAYVDRRAALLHRLVDALGDESSRYLLEGVELALELLLGDAATGVPDSRGLRGGLGRRGVDGRAPLPRVAGAAVGGCGLRVRRGVGGRA
ncbi:hypothetical protein [Streptomyces sp. NPDC056817]|uniref:hypothetical protein n=1 Tax=Streptomyces sp. NPDC056817 TaxID=3345950 RepID=UPI00369A6CC6